MLKIVSVALLCAACMISPALAGPTAYSYRPAATTYKTCDLPDAVTLTDTDRIEISRNCAGSYNASFSEIVSYILGKISGQTGGENHVVVNSPTTNVPVANTLQTLSLSADTTLAVPGIPAGQRLCLVFIQDATGGRKITFPSNFIGQFVVGAGPNTRSTQCFSYSGFLSAYVAESAGVINK